jgi:hypothetical protein
MSVVLFDDIPHHLAFTPDIGALKIARIEGPGRRLDAAYELLARVFDPAVLDSKDTYVDLLSPGGLQLDGFPIICVAAYFEHGGQELIVGVSASNLMWIDRSAGMLQLAIGNIATSPQLHAMKFRGIGTALLERSIEVANSLANRHSADLAYSVAEAEANSRRFWRKSDYFFVEGLQYLQPPLEFDSSGNPIHDAVPETFMVRPLSAHSREYIRVEVIRQMIVAIYRNWCIETNRHRLSHIALQKAETFVLQEVFNRVSGTLPVCGTARLTELESNSY